MTMKHFAPLSTFLAISVPSLVRCVAITGATSGIQASGERPSRLELSTLANAGPAFDLYILALQQFQNDGQAALLSYYQVAGIHGRPFIPWDGVQGGNGDGYCTHSSILFPTWHRPYLALIEQIIHSNAQTIALSYPQPSRAQYTAAASTLRIPYWDWALNATMPTQVNQPTISVNGPNGTQLINNPLYTYTFHPQPSSSDFPASDGDFATWPSTLRYPDANGKSQPDLANQQLQANGQALHDMTYQLLSDQSSYGPFSNTGWDSGNGGNSIENMHNAIHGLVGNGGHMSYVPYSAFDPIFWLHHTNVDRLFAIWQALYPDSYVTPQSSSGTFTNDFGSTEDINTPLTPFHSSSGTGIFNSITARSTRTFGYTYPEIKDWNATLSALSTSVRTAINSLYEPTGSLRRRSLGKGGPQTYNYTLSLPPTSFVNLTLPFPANANTASGATEGALESYQYFAQTIVAKHALNGSFFIHFYLGPPACNSSATMSWAPNLIGTVTILATEPKDGGIGMMSNGQVSLTHSLLRPSINLPSLHPTHTIPFLTSRLQWRIQLMNDTVVPTTHSALRRGRLQISVAGRTVTHTGDVTAFPIYGQLTTYASVTVGKAGGIGGYGGGGNASALASGTGKARVAPSASAVGAVAVSGASRARGAWFGR